VLLLQLMVVNLVRLVLLLVLMLLVLRCLPLAAQALLLLAARPERLPLQHVLASRTATAAIFVPAVPEPVAVALLLLLLMLVLEGVLRQQTALPAAHCASTGAAGAAGAARVQLGCV
jgi:hypothetical protein